MEEPGPDGSERASVVAVLSALDKNSILIVNSVYKLALKLPTSLLLRAIPISPASGGPIQYADHRVAIRDNSGRLGRPNSIRHTSRNLSLDTSKPKERWE
jgi:hypothetical protein